ncbi:MAG: DUF4157 domain-containing protein [Bacteroidia bacterium]|nr:DUF4157 domain-containing protein [Bacteroidia bacterium]
MQTHINKSKTQKQRNAQADPQRPTSVIRPNNIFFAVKEALQAKKVAAQMQAKEEELQMKQNPTQMQGLEEEEMMQGKFETAQMQGLEEEEMMQGKFGTAQMKEETAQHQSHPSATKQLPQDLQANAENVLQEDLSDVKVTESEKASDVGALAYTQGDQLVFAPGQFQPDTQKGQELIGHELAHVKQQRQGRVQPTTQAKGLPVNDDAGLEKEANRVGEEIASQKKNNLR